MRKTADTAVPVHPLLAERWSPRGFDPAAVRATFALDDTLTPVVVIAIGRAAPDPARTALAARETAPRTRRPLTDLLLNPAPPRKLTAVA